VKRRPGLESPLGMVPALLLVLPPLVWLAWTLLQLPKAGFHGLDRVGWSLLLRSLKVSGLATALALGIGTLYGWITAGARGPLKALLAGAALMNLCLPTYAAGYAWKVALQPEGWLTDLLTRAGLPVPQLFGCWAAAALLFAGSYWPLVAAAVYLALNRIPREQVDAARLHLSNHAAMRWCSRVYLARTLPAVGLLVFLLSLVDFGLPNSLGVPTYPREITNTFQLARNPVETLLVGWPIVLLGLPLLWLQLRLLHHLETAPDTTGVAADPARSWPLATAVMLLVPSLTLAVPLGTLIANSLPLQTYADVWAESADHLGNTLITSASAGLLVTGLALLFGWSARRRKLRLLDLALTLPYALPASLIGIALIQMTQPPSPLRELYSSTAGLLWAYIVLFYPFAHKLLQHAWSQLDESLDADARLHGAGAATRFRVIAWETVRPIAALSTALVALLASRELDATYLLRIPDGDTIAFRVHDYLHFAPGPKVSALCVLLTLLAAGAVLLGGWIYRSSARLGSH
jgi:iron(III) transport system permease protein